MTDNSAILQILQSMNANIGNLSVGFAPIHNPIFTGTVTAGAIAASSINFGDTSLANYKDGTWTPLITTDATVGTPAYTTNVGSYTRIGRVIIAQFTIVLSGWTGSPTGKVIISGLPVAASATASDNASCYISQYAVTGLAASNYGVAGTIIPSATQILLYSQGNAGTTQITAAQAGTMASFIGNCVYHV